MNKKWIIKNNQIVQIKKKKNNEWCSLKRDLQEILKLKNKVEKLTIEKRKLQKLIYSKNITIKKYKSQLKFITQNKREPDQNQA